jgi:hypothetical protein
LVAAGAACWGAGELCMIEFMPHTVVLVAHVVLVRLHDIDHHLGVLFLLVLGNTDVR